MSDEPLLGSGSNPIPSVVRHSDRQLTSFPPPSHSLPDATAAGMRTPDMYESPRSSGERISSPTRASQRSSRSVNNTPERGERRKPLRAGGGSMQQRMKFYYKLSSPRSSSQGFLLAPPKHVLPSFLYSFGGGKGKQSSIATIFSIVTTMMGATVLSIPWGLGRSGLALGIFISAFICLVSWYTCSLILKSNQELKFGDFADLCGHFISPRLRDVCLLTSLFLMIGTGMAYATIITDSVGSVYNFVASLHDTSAVAAPPSVVEKIYISLIVVAFLYPISCLKDVSVIVRVSAIGTFCTLNLLIFTVYQSVGLNWDKISVQTPDLAEAGWPDLAGVMFLSYTVHNAIIPITSNQQHPQHTQRNVGLAYLIVFLLFTAPAALWWLTFHKDVCVEGQICKMASNFLTGFKASSLHATITRLGIFLQLFIVLPLIMFVVRIIVFSKLYENTYPGLPQVMLLNASLLVVYFGVACSGVSIGPVLKYTGGICGALYTYVFPVWVHLAAQRKAKTLTKCGIFGHVLISLFGVSICLLQFIPLGDSSQSS